MFPDHTRRGWAWRYTAGAYQTIPIRLAVMTVLLDAVAATALLFVSSEAASGVRVAVVLGAVAFGTLAVLCFVFVWAWITAPRHEIQERLLRVESMVGELYEQRFGSPTELRPSIYALLTDVREALRLIRHAQETGTFWRWNETLPDKEWKRVRDRLGQHPDFKILYGSLVEAYAKVDRLNGTRATSWTRRGRVEPQDDLDGAEFALMDAEMYLESIIDVIEDTP